MPEKLSYEEFVRRAIESLRAEGGIKAYIVCILDLMTHLEDTLMERIL